jgi:hypothetical protein
MLTVAQTFYGSLNKSLISRDYTVSNCKMITNDLESI